MDLEWWQIAIVALAGSVGLALGCKIAFTFDVKPMARRS